MEEHFAHLLEDLGVVQGKIKKHEIKKNSTTKGKHGGTEQEHHIKIDRRMTDNEHFDVREESGLIYSPSAQMELASR